MGSTEMGLMLCMAWGEERVLGFSGLLSRAVMVLGVFSAFACCNGCCSCSFSSEWLTEWVFWSVTFLGVDGGYGG